LGGRRGKKTVEIEYYLAGKAKKDTIVFQSKLAAESWLYWNRLNVAGYRMREVKTNEKKNH
jgi:hypothetical protein